jgi:hypothetical protein
MGVAWRLRQRCHLLHPMSKARIRPSDNEVISPPEKAQMSRFQVAQSDGMEAGDNRPTQLTCLVYDGVRETVLSESDWHAYCDAAVNREIATKRAILARGQPRIKRQDALLADAGDKPPSSDSSRAPHGLRERQSVLVF